MSVAVMEREDWDRHAACLGEDRMLFFPERGASTSTARAICRGCPVRRECLDAAMHEEHGKPRQLRHGIRGGLSADERARIATHASAR